MIATIIANEFSKQLRQQLTAEQMEEVIRLNAAELDKIGICHTHDFCDGNEIMLHALEALGIERISDALWNEAWSIAKGAGFTPAPSVAGTQPTLRHRIADLLKIASSSEGGPSEDAVFDYVKALHGAAILRPYFPPASQTPNEVVGIEYYRSRLAFLRNQIGFIERNFPELATPASTARTSPAHFSDCDYDCSCGWKKDPDSHLGAVRD